MIHAGRSRLSVTYESWSRQSQSVNGHLGSMVHRPAMKWSLKIWTATLAVLRKCRPAGVSWNLIFSSSRNSFSMSEHSLSSLCRMGRSPWAWDSLMACLCARCNCVFVRFGITIGRMYCES